VERPSRTPRPAACRAASVRTPASPRCTAGCGPGATSANCSIVAITSSVTRTAPLIGPPWTALKPIASGLRRQLLQDHVDHVAVGACTGRRLADALVPAARDLLAVRAPCRGA
jgi:hypothetical protein